MVCKEGNDVAMTAQFADSKTVGKIDKPENLGASAFQADECQGGGV